MYFFQSERMANAKISIFKTYNYIKDILHNNMNVDECINS